MLFICRVGTVSLHYYTVHGTSLLIWHCRVLIIIIIIIIIIVIFIIVIAVDITAIKQPRGTIK